MVHYMVLQGVDNFLWDYILIVSMIVAILAFMMSSRGKRQIELLIPQNIKTELICVSCGFKEIRKYREGDYISKISDEKCRKCGGNTKISLIYVVSQEHIKQ